MKSSEVVNVHGRDVRGHLNRVYDLYSSRVVKIERDYIESTYRRRRTNVSCQCNIRRGLTCTCRKAESPEPRYFSSPKQVYRYSDWRSYTDVGVGSVKALPRKRIRKIYLPETIDRAVGSADLTSYINNNKKSRQEWASSYYENKKTSSKCVGGFLENDKVCLLSKQLSPIIHKKSGTTSPRSEILKGKDINIGSSDLEKYKASFHTQVNTEDFKNASINNKIKSNQTSKQTLQAEVTTDVLPTVADNLKSIVINDNTENCKDYSSDSFVQHVHNLEIPSDNKQSKMSVDPMENKLEREYRKIFATTSKEKPSVEKPMQDFKTASLLRRRFEALRRGLGKKESKKDSILLNKIPSQNSMPSRKDVSIASDPPSLEGRSYSNTKVYSPFQSTTNEYKLQPKISHKKSPKNKNVKDNSQWSPEVGDSKCESVQGMFKLWGKKFNLDEDNCKTSPTISNDVSRAPEEISKAESPPLVEFPKKKQGRKFFIFGKKSKDKESKQSNYKPKKGVTAGRCEVKDGLTIKVGGPNNEYTVKKPVIKQEKYLEKYEDILRKGWLDKFITSTRDSRNSVHIRWNNKMYTTSSSTILELMDSVYKHTGIDFRSRSEITTRESSNYRSYTKQRVHFMQQDVEAWMIPKMITYKQRKQATDDRVYNNRDKCQRWFVDASKGFSKKIELVVHSKPNSNSSEYVIINIPEGYFSKPSSELRPQSSDEEIYKIIEYDTSELKKKKENRQMSTGDTFTGNTKDTVSIQNDVNNENKGNDIPDKSIKKPSFLRDVAIQGSTVFLPKRCDVIGVGIITQRDIRDVTNPILKVEDELSDDESEENLSVRQKKCELAESYLQDYCRNLMPSAVDILSWRLSGSQLQSSDNNSVASLSQGDGSKSYPNMYDNMKESTVALSSCETSSCSHCIALEDERKQEDSLKCKFFNKFKKKSSEAPMVSDKRQCPKDSLEVYKRRQYYAYTNQKCKWFTDESETHSFECKAKTDCPKINKPCWRLPDDSRNKKRRKQKRVSLPGCEAMGKLIDKLSDRMLEGILSYKGSEHKKKGSRVAKHASTSPSQVCEIPQPPCKESCLQEKKPPCSKKNADPCDELNQPSFCPGSPVPPCEVKPASPPRSPPLCVKPQKKPPCSACTFPRKVSSQSLFKQVSPKKSQESGLSLKMSPSPSPKSSDACFPNRSKESLKECIPNCANKTKINKIVNTPPTPPPTAYHMPQKPTGCKNDSNEKVTGLHLKKFPSKRTDSNQCVNSKSYGVIRLNSQEEFTIRMKKDTPSTEEIRDNLNIKVQDEDGQTLYERMDYTRSSDVNKCVLLKDVYKAPQIQRVSTPIIIQTNTAQKKSQNEIHADKSDTSVDNLIEINFTLKLKQGDKGTEVNIKNGGDAEIKHNKEAQIIESQKDIYIIQNQNQADPDSVAPGNKNDVNIKIVIKNYKTDPDKCNEPEPYELRNTNKENFTKRISEKFQTVSTGYSDTDQHAFSIHRATVDLTTSDDRCCVESKPSECVSNIDLVNVSKKLLTSSQSIKERSITEQTVHSIKFNNEEEIITPSRKKSSTNNICISTEASHEGTDTIKAQKPDNYSLLEFGNHIVDETSNDSVLYKKLKLRNRREKKSLFKKLFHSSSAVKKPENKKKIKEIIRAILTSDSSGTEIVVTSNGLAKELTYASLDPHYLRVTDSMNNYYHFDSEMSNCEESKSPKLNPSKENSELSVNESVTSFGNEKKTRCLCSTLATKLNITLNGDPDKCNCCCRENVKRDQEITCGLGNEECNINVQTCIDVETQNSKHVSSKINCANLTVQSTTQSVVIANTSVQIQNSINTFEDSTPRRKYIKTTTPDSVNLKHYGINKLNRETLLRLSDDDMIIFNSNTVQTSVSRFKRKKTSKHIDSKNVGADILQLNETKKAVLEIYAEKIVSDEGEKMVAKLPKFHVQNENDITNYEDIVTGRKKVSKRNFVMMTVNR